MTRQNERQASVRAVTGTAYSYNDDWRALFDQAGIAAGNFNDRLRAWINGQLGTSYTNINDAMRAFAVDQGFTRWDEMGTFDAGGVPDEALFDRAGATILDRSGDYILLRA
jgi:hypothetical protein